MNKKILIPYASYGNGHKAIAQYIEAYFKKQNPDYEILTLDILAYSIPILGNISQKVAMNLMIKHPLLWSALYTAFDNKISGAIPNTLTKIFKNKKLQKAIIDFDPDLTISTHFWSSSLMAHYKKKGITKSRLVTVVTDYIAHELWLRNSKIEDAIVVGSKEEKNNIIKRGFDKKKVKAYGIPIAPMVTTDFNRKTSLQKLGLKGDKPICLFFAGGGKGNKAVVKYVKKIMEMDLNIDFLFVSGNGKEIKEKVDKLVKEYNATNFKVFGFVTNVPELLQVCDFVVTKPGGAQSTEALYFKKPAVLLNGNGGQEVGNSKFFVKNGYGIRLRTSFGVSRFMCEINKNPDILEQYRINLSKNKTNEAMEKLYRLSVEVLKK